MYKNIIIIAGFLFLASCNNKKTEEESVEITTNSNIATLTDAQIKNAGIELGKIEQKEISEVLTLNGQIDVPPQNLYSVSVPMGGYVKNAKLLEGTYVKKGQVLVTIENQEYIQIQEEYLMAKSKIAYARDDFERQRELNKSKATSDKVFQQAKSEYNSLLVALKTNGAKLKYAGINPDRISSNNITKSIGVYAPISGYISKANVNAGSYVNASDILYEIINPSDIHLALKVFEKDIHNLSIGQTVFAYTNANPTKKYRAKIILIGNDFTEDRSITIHCHFTEATPKLLPGMYMNGEIELNSQQSNVLPADAIVSFENKNYVFVANANKQFEMKEVIIGNTENSYTQISTAELQNAKIVIKGAYALLMKLKNVE